MKKACNHRYQVLNHWSSIYPPESDWGSSPGAFSAVGGSSAGLISSDLSIYKAERAQKLRENTQRLDAGRLGDQQQVRFTNRSAMVSQQDSSNSLWLSEEPAGNSADKQQSKFKRNGILRTWGSLKKIIQKTRSFSVPGRCFSGAHLSYKPLSSTAQSISWYRTQPWIFFLDIQKATGVLSFLQGRQPKR